MNDHQRTVKDRTGGKLRGAGQGGDGGEEGGGGAGEVCAQLQAAGAGMVHIDAGRCAVLQPHGRQVALLCRARHPVVRIPRRRRQPAPAIRQIRWKMGSWQYSACLQL